MQGSPEYLQRLEADITRLRARLGIGADQPDWADGSDMYKVGLGDLWMGWGGGALWVHCQVVDL